MPKAGNTILVFDLVDAELRSRPLTIQVVEAVSEPEPKTVLYIPPNTYPTGVVSAEANLDLPGKYTAIVTLEGQSNTIQFPIRVAMWAPSVRCARWRLVPRLRSRLRFHGAEKRMAHTLRAEESAKTPTGEGVISSTVLLDERRGKHMATIASAPVGGRTQRVEAPLARRVLNLTKIGMGLVGITTVMVAARIYQLLFAWTKGAGLFLPRVSDVLVEFGPGRVGTRGRCRRAVVGVAVEDPGS